MGYTFYRNDIFDFIKMIFYSKKCLCCGQKMKRISEKNKYERKSKIPDEYDDEDTYEIMYYYYCENCKIRTEVSNLKFK